MDWPKRMSGQQESEPLHGKHQISSFICQGLCIAIQETYTRRCFRFFVLFIHSPIPSEYKLFCKGIDQLLAKGTVQAFMDYSLAQWLYSGWDAINKWLHWQWQCWIWPPVGTWWTNISDIGKDADDECLEGLEVWYWGAHPTRVVASVQGQKQSDGWGIHGCGASYSMPVVAVEMRVVVSVVIDNEFGVNVELQN